MDIDSKTLLLGDIAENSSWWTGERPPIGSPAHASANTRTIEASTSLVTPKSPRIDWIEVGSWYRCVLTAGINWRDEWVRFEAGSSSTSPSTKDAMEISPEVATEIETQFAKSRTRLRTTLLKAFEDLLKRPKRPLRRAEDSRFLLIILSNPLICPDPLFPLPKSELAHRGGPGTHSGIVKRVLGLLAHVPNEVHHHFVSWFSRLSVNRFDRLIGLVNGFVNHRLARPVHKQAPVNPTDSLVPSFTDPETRHPSQLHAALGTRHSSTSRPRNGTTSHAGRSGGSHNRGRSRHHSNTLQLADYADDWQVRASARVMALLFAANGSYSAKKRDYLADELSTLGLGVTPRSGAQMQNQLVPIDRFYNTMLDYADLITDFENWESSRGTFSFCQYPFFLSIYAKIRLLEMEARRQMELKAREAFFDSILGGKAVSQWLVLKVRRDCLVDDS